MRYCRGDLPCEAPTSARTDARRCQETLPLTPPASIVIGRNWRHPRGAVAERAEGFRVLGRRERHSLPLHRTQGERIGLLEIAALVAIHAVVAGPKQDAADSFPPAEQIQVRRV